MLPQPPAWCYSTGLLQVLQPFCDWIIRWLHIHFWWQAALFFLFGCQRFCSSVSPLRLGNNTQFSDVECTPSLTLTSTACNLGYTFVSSNPVACISCLVLSINDRHNSHTSTILGSISTPRCLLCDSVTAVCSSCQFPYKLAPANHSCSLCADGYFLEPNMTVSTCSPCSFIYIWWLFAVWLTTFAAHMLTLIHISMYVVWQLLYSLIVTWLSGTLSECALCSDSVTCTSCNDGYSLTADNQCSGCASGSVSDGTVPCHSCLLHALISPFLLTLSLIYFICLRNNILSRRQLSRRRWMQCSYRVQQLQFRLLLQCDKTRVPSLFVSVSMRRCWHENWISCIMTTALIWNAIHHAIV